MAFYGLPEADRAEVMAHTRAIADLYRKHNKNIINIDNMLLALRSMRFWRDADFDAAIQQYCYDGEVQLPNNLTKVWRLHVYTWCAAQGLRLTGDLVECGVHMGLYSLVMMRTLNFGHSDKQIYLYDTFEGLAEDYSSSDEQHLVEGVYDIADWEQQVRNSFSIYQNAHVIKGEVPGVLQDTAPETVSFLHIDMNAAQAEVAAMDFFKSRLTPGAIVLLDDYGRSENAVIGEAHKDWFDRAGRTILELPTGQGIIVWT